MNKINCKYCNAEHSIKTYHYRAIFISLGLYFIVLLLFVLDCSSLECILLALLTTMLMPAIHTYMGIVFIFVISGWIIIPVLENLKKYYTEKCFSCKKARYPELSFSFVFSHIHNLFIEISNLREKYFAQKQKNLLALKEPNKRNLPLRFKIRVLLSGRMCVFLFLSIIFFFVGGLFFVNADYKAVLYYGSEIIELDARILSKSKTGASVNGIEIVSYEYIFRTNKENKEQLCYDIEKHQIGDTIKIEFLHEFNISRIKGGRNAVFVLNTVFYVLIILVIISFIGIKIAKTDIQKISILQKGDIFLGKTKGYTEETTYTSEGDKSVSYNLKIEFRVDENTIKEMTTEVYSIEEFEITGTEVTVAYLKNYKYETLLMDRLGLSFVTWAKNYISTINELK